MAEVLEATVVPEPERWDLSDDEGLCMEALERGEVVVSDEGGPGASDSNTELAMRKEDQSPGGSAVRDPGPSLTPGDDGILASCQASPLRRRTSKR